MRWFVLLALATPLLAGDIDWDTAVKAVREEMGEGYRVEHVGRFVVATDADGETGKRAERTLTACADALLKDYFSTPPSWALTAYLFKGNESYTAYVKKRFGHDPDSPYGFYQPSGKCLVMDISTGTGTLVHEMVHAFAEADFPAIPAWFNEGMGSLHEQCDFDDQGSLRGLTSWRLPILQKALKDETVPSWKDLTHKSTEQFYKDGKSDNYAVARYLVMWLQKQGLLKTYYAQFRDHAKDDPTGWDTLQAVIKRPVDDVERDWRAWASKLEWKR